VIVRTPVESSNIVSVGYDGARKLLHVEFKGGVYEYADFPQEAHAEFMLAGSKGSFFAKVIKGNPLYPSRKLDPSEVEG
jgi:hypothetical protein